MDDRDRQIEELVRRVAETEDLLKRQAQVGSSLKGLIGCAIDQRRAAVLEARGARQAAESAMPVDAVLSGMREAVGTMQESSMALILEMQEALRQSHARQKELSGRYEDLLKELERGRDAGTVRFDFSRFYFQ